MTLQDSIETIDQNLITFAQNLLPVIFLIFVFFLIIIFGFLAAYLIRLVINQISTILNLEKLFLGVKTIQKPQKKLG